MERLETLTGKYGDEGDQLMYKVLCRGNKLTKALDDGASTANALADLALRYDLTVPLARVYAQYRHQLPTVFKRYQIAPVWRADRPQRGRYREFYQCDVDVIGSSSLWVEAECLGALSSALAELQFGGFRIHLNHRALLRAAIEVSGIPVALETTTLVAMDKLDKIGRDGVLAEMSARGVDSTGAEALLSLLSPEGQDLSFEENGAFIDHLRQALSQHEAGLAALDELSQVLALVAHTPAAGCVCLDPTLARGLSYYTGPIFEIRSDDFSGSLGGGGRYDDLIGMFGKESVPACGFSLGLERICLLMDERGLLEDVRSSSDALVTVYDAESAGHALSIARELRTAGLRVDVYGAADKLGKQFRFAAERGIPTAIVCGPDERANGEVTIKNLATREQQTVARADLVSHVRQALGDD